MSGSGKHHSPSSADRIAALEAQLAALTARATAAETALANLRRAYTKALEELQLMKRRLFVAKAERADGLAEQQLAFDKMFEKVEQLAKQLDTATANDEASDDDGKRNGTRKPTGRRNLADADLPEERIEVLDPALEKSAVRIGFDFSYRLGYQRGGMRKLVIATACYRTSDAVPMSEGAESSEAATDIEATLLPGARLRERHVRRGGNARKMGSRSARVGADRFEALSAQRSGSIRVVRYQERRTKDGVRPWSQPSPSAGQVGAVS